MTEPTDHEPVIRDVDVHAASDLAANGALILDVREPDEWSEGHIAGATHTPLGDLDPQTVPRDAPVVAVCRSGNRSAKAARLLVDSGHDVVNMAGGMKAWQDAGLPISTDTEPAGNR